VEERHQIDNQTDPKTRSIPVILIGDSNLADLSLTASYLRNSGYHVITTPDSYRLVRLTQRESPSLIIISDQLKGHDGYETCAVIKLHHQFDVPVLFYSSDSSENSILRAYDSGADDYLHKPVPESILRAKIKVHIRHAESTASESTHPMTSSDTPDGKTADAFLPAYTMVEKIGSGATGAVFRALNKATNESVAVKVIKPSQLGNVRDLQRFFRGALIGLELPPHPCLVQILEIKRTPDFIYQIMEYVPGRTLQAIIRSGIWLKESEAMSLIECIARALNHLHDHQVLHRDVKPGNIFVTDSWQAKLGDLGISRRMIDRTATTIGHVVGTPGYLAPEQVLDARPIDIRADLYSLGLTIHHAVTGTNPYERESPYASILARLDGDEAILDPTLNRNLSPVFCTMINKLTRRRPEERFATPFELLEEINRIPRV